MKTKFFYKILIVCFFTFFALKTHAQYQLCGSAATLTKSNISLGINPYMMIYNGENVDKHTYFGSNFYFNAGFPNIVEAQVRFGILYDKYNNPPENYDPLFYYLGLEIKKFLFFTGRINKPGFGMSVTGGIHSFYSHLGVDGAINVTYRHNRHLYIYSGFDADYNQNSKKPDNFSPDEKYWEFFGWVPVGAEIRPNDKLSIIIECDIPITGNAHWIPGIGLKYFF